MPLPPYQQAGIARLLAAPGVLLADEMGLGKTIQAIGALCVLLRPAPAPLHSALLRPAPLRPALIVVPAGLVLQWRRQLLKWASELTLSTCLGSPEERRQRWRTPAQIYLVGFDALRGDMAPDSIEQRIGDTLAEKRVLFADIIDGVANPQPATSGPAHPAARRRGVVVWRGEPGAPARLS